MSCILYLILIVKLARSKTMLFFFISRAFADCVSYYCTDVLGLAKCGSKQDTKGS